MSWFKRKKKEQSNITMSMPAKIECSHVWKDFSPYAYNYKAFYNYNEKRLDHGSLSIKIIEPYVCCKCFKRDNVELYSLYFDDIKETQAIERFEKIKKENPFIKPRPQVEDEIEDMRHQIDRDLLRTLALYRPSSIGSTMPNNLPILEKFLSEEKKNDNG